MWFPARCRLLRRLDLLPAAHLPQRHLQLLTGVRRRRLVAVAVLALALAPLVAHADIEEQRRRLPPSPEGCPDPIEGDWSSVFWTRGYWLSRTLHVHRTSPGASTVVGTVDVESWIGPASDPTHACDAAHSPWYVGVMPAQGTFDGTTLDFLCTSFTLRETRCGIADRYNPDHFTGPLVSNGTEIHTTNDDAGHLVSTVVFRRTACAEAPPPPSPLPPPPTGCSCRF